MTSKARRAAAREEAVARPGAIARAAEVLREALGRWPLLPLQHAALPSATAAIIGGPLAGSWRAHPQREVIAGVFQSAEVDVTTARVLGGEVTLVARPLWASLIALGSAEEAWQLAGLRPEARALLAHVASAGAVRTDRLREAGDARAVGRAVEQLERRLLVASAQIRDAAGKPVRELSTWRRWQRQLDLAATALPSPEVARASFEVAATALQPGAEAQLPWVAAGSTAAR